MKSLIKPKKLQPGDQVAAVSLSWGGPGTFPWRYQAGKAQLEKAFGLRVVEMPNTLREADWLRAHPQARAEDLMRAFADPEIKAVISTIGGEDSIRILPYLDLQVLRANPKIFLGFSDSTVTHLACCKAGLGSFYGPAMMAGFAENGGLFPYMEKALRKMLFCTEPVGLLTPNMDGWTDEILDWAEPANQSMRRKLQPRAGWHFLQGEGLHCGRLIGGCLEVLDWLRGSPVWPDVDEWQDAVLFLETSEEGPSPQAVARMLRALAAQGILGKLSGLLFGRPGGQVGVERFAEYDQAILKILIEEQGLTKIPIVTGMDFGHTDPMLVLPYGVEMQIDCDRQQLSITENAVVE